MKKLHELSPDNLDDIAAMLRAIAEPSRLRILQCLHQGEKSVGQIVEQTGGLQANTSKQLKHLQSVRLIQHRKEGSTVYYRISDSCVYRMCESICDGYVRLLSKKLKRVSEN